MKFSVKQFEFDKKLIASLQQILVLSPSFCLSLSPYLSLLTITDQSDFIVERTTSILPYVKYAETRIVLKNL